MSAARRIVDFEVKLDGRRVDSETTGVWAGPYALTIATALPDRGLALTLTSTFVGHEGVATHATHLALGPPGHDPEIGTTEHSPASLDPALEPRGCMYEHVQILLDRLKQLGHEVSIEVPEDAFVALERIED